VQGFFTFRVYTLSKRLYITLVISVMLLLRLLSTCGVFVTGISMTSLLSFERQWGWMVIVSLAISSATDLTITTLLVGFLLKQCSNRYCPEVSDTQSLNLAQDHGACG
jgi:hypothetical protein